MIANHRAELERALQEQETRFNQEKEKMLAKYDTEKEQYIAECKAFMETKFTEYEEILRDLREQLTQKNTKSGKNTATIAQLRAQIEKINREKVELTIALNALKDEKTSFPQQITRLQEQLRNIQQKHEQDLKEIVNKHYDILNKFYGSSQIKSILKKIVALTNANGIETFSNNTELNTYTLQQSKLGNTDAYDIQLSKFLLKF